MRVCSVEFMNSFLLLYTNLLASSIRYGRCFFRCVFSDNRWWVIEVKATAGDTHLDREDFVNRIVDLCTQDVNGVNREKDLAGNNQAIRQLRTQCERAIRTMFSSSQAAIGIDLQTTRLALLHGSKSSSIWLHFLDILTSFGIWYLMSCTSLRMCGYHHHHHHYHPEPFWLKFHKKEKSIWCEKVNRPQVSGCSRTSGHKPTAAVYSSPDEGSVTPPLEKNSLRKTMAFHSAF